MTSDKIRHAILAGLPEDILLHGKPAKRAWIYLPDNHAKALGLECSLVIGACGVGKSTWWATLQSEENRLALTQRLPVLQSLVVTAGYGERPDLRVYPDMATFEDLIEVHGHQPLHIWRAIAARWTGNLLNTPVPSHSWPETVDWVTTHPEAFATLMERADHHLQSQSRHGLMVFDALDRTSRHWRQMDRIVRDLINFIIYLKQFNHLHAKVFLREDQFEGRLVNPIQDASKVLAYRGELTWGLLDLHGLLWQYLINAPERYGVFLRRMVYPNLQLRAPLRHGIDYYLPHQLRMEESQRQLFAKLAGDMMGKNPRRGNPYTWMVSHLADGRGRAFPRSFMASMRHAVEASLQQYPDHDLPLPDEAIRRGVQKASQVRVDELKEDYPWIARLMEPLRGLIVPCTVEEIKQRWQETDGLDPVTFQDHGLPPEHLAMGAAGVVQDLISLGIMERMNDGRLNMPDIYRVGFQLGRRGGVKPLPRLANDSA